mmetsp:Transcript_27181/g.49278  ORF Transcript_27181/g.49278 Transcript_27181/m.49278 type:complete len:96 (-) Transcript_27181:987-1274(-)
MKRRAGTHHWRMISFYYSNSSSQVGKIFCIALGLQNTEYWWCEPNTDKSVPRSSVFSSLKSAHRSNLLFTVLNDRYFKIQKYKSGIIYFFDSKLP